MILFNANMDKEDCDILRARNINVISIFVSGLSLYKCFTHINHEYILLRLLSKQKSHIILQWGGIKQILKN